MKSHNKDVLESVSCPFAVGIKDVDFDNVASVISVDDKEGTIVVEMNDKTRFLVQIPNAVYDAIWRSGEQNVIDQDLGFNELY